MLTGNACHFWFDYISPKNLDLIALATAIKKRFQTTERTRALLREWDTMSLKEIMDVNADKTPSVCVELFITTLTDIQTSLPKEYRNDMILWNKLLNAKRKVDNCRVAYQKSAESFHGVIPSLHALLTSATNATTSTRSATQS